jgi:hypothetical protein
MEIHLWTHNKLHAVTENDLGVFYFKEIRVSAVVAIMGIISLSYQHGGRSGGH